MLPPKQNTNNKKNHWPKSWWNFRWRRRASSDWARSTTRWCYLHCPECTSVCCHSSPKAWPGRLCRLTRTKNHRARRSRCSSSRCGRSGWPLACSWPNSRPWRFCPSQLTQLSGWTRWARIARMIPNRCAHLPFFFVFRKKLAFCFLIFHFGGFSGQSSPFWMLKTARFFFSKKGAQFLALKSNKKNWIAQKEGCPLF